MKLENHLMRQMAFSHATFGPGTRVNGVVDHIRKELDEVLESDGDPREWVDVVILALDGLTRAIAFDDGRRTRQPGNAARAASTMIEEKQSRNEARAWPDWRTADQGKAIEHIKTTERRD